MGREEEGRGGGGRATKAKGEERGGVRSKLGWIQGDTTTPQNHNHNEAPNRRRQGRGGSNEELKEKQNKVKINSSEHYDSDYRRAK